MRDAAPARLFRPRSASTGRLSTFELTILLVMLHAPFVLVWGGMPTVFQYGRVVATPLVYLLGGVVYILFWLGVAGMSRRIRHQGGLYPFVAHGLGGTTGLGVAMLGIFAYLIMLIQFLILVGTALVGLSTSLWHQHPPVWTGVLVAIALAGGLVALPLRTTIRVLAVIAIVQFAGVLWFSVSAVGHPTDSVSFEALDPGWLLTGSFGMSLCFTLQAFLGSEAASNYAEDVRESGRGIPRATLIALTATTITATLAAWALTVTTGPDNTVFLAVQSNAATTTDKGIPFLFVVILGIVGPENAQTVTNLISALLVIGALGAVVAQAHTLSRQLSGLARDGVLPGRLRNATGHSPGLAVKAIALGVPGALALFIYDPEDTNRLIYIGVLAGLAMTLVLAVTSLATTIWYLRGDESEAGFIGWEGRVAASALTMVATAVLFVFGAVKAPAAIYPDSPGGYRVAVFALIGGVFLLGVAWAWILKVRAPDLFARIGGRATSAAADLPGQPERPSAEPTFAAAPQTAAPHPAAAPFATAAPYTAAGPYPAAGPSDAAGAHAAAGPGDTPWPVSSAPGRPYR